MPGFLLHAGATVLCAHGGQALPTAPKPARAGRRASPSRRQAAPYTVAGCAFVAAGGNGPCVTAQWIVGAVRVLAGGQPVLLQDELGRLRADGHAAERRRHPDAGEGDLTMQLDFPYRIDARGRTAETDDDAHMRDLIEQVLFTAPGERVNRPTFGSGLLALVFEPNGEALAAATEHAVQGALQLWLGELIVRRRRRRHERGGASSR